MTPIKYRNKITGKEFRRNASDDVLRKQGQLYPDCHKPTHDEMIAYGYFKQITKTPTELQKEGTDWVYVGEECWLGIVDKTPEEIQADKDSLILFVKSRANELITDIIPEWKQRNYTARAVELLNARSEGAVLTETEQSELDGIKAIFGDVKAIRLSSDGIELEVQSGAVTTREQIINHISWNI